MVPLRDGLGALKVTTALFFRPGGQSTQNGGVNADILVPSGFATNDFGEAHQDYSLPNQTINSFLKPESLPSTNSSTQKKFWTPITPELVTELSRRSQERLVANEEMIEIRERIVKIEERNGVVHLAELMAEQKEEKEKQEGKEALPSDETQAAEDASDSTSATETAMVDETEIEVALEVESEEPGTDEKEFSLQQAEAVQILVDLIQLSS